MGPPLLSTARIAAVSRTALLILFSFGAGWLGAGQWRLYQESLGDRGVIEPEAIKLIQFSELPEPVAELLDEAMHRRLTGRTATAFDAAFAAAEAEEWLKKEKQDSRILYTVFLPVDKEERASQIAGDEYMHSANLWIEVDRKTGLIKRYHLYILRF